MADTGKVPVTDVVIVDEVRTFVLPPVGTSHPVVSVDQVRTVIIDNEGDILVVQEPLPLVLPSGPAPITVTQETIRCPV